MLPVAFQERMRRLLGEEFVAFERALGQEAVRGFRINPLKADESILPALAAFSPVALPYTDDGFRYQGEKIGNTPYHHAGAIYVQDPGAMCALCAVDIRPGWRVADLCAAPGGKSAQIAARIGEDGFLLSNEFVPTRAKITVGNFERLGLRRAMVTSMDTAVLGTLYHAFFDLVVADAPCSGEGMFRKENPALEEWSPEAVQLCAERQAQILDNAAPLVKDGGLLLYSTCTFSPEENEETVDAFIGRHPDFSLIDVCDRILLCTAPGIRLHDGMCEGIEKCRRFYPHLSPGEGQFVAVMRKKDRGDAPAILYRDSSASPGRPEQEALAAFFRETVHDLSLSSVRMIGGNPVIVPDGIPVPPFSVFSAGVLIGEIRGRLLFPHHQFFSAYGRHFLRQVNLSATDPRTVRYLRGEQIDANVENGWCAVLCDGIPLGGGKAVDGQIKNHYPKGLRLKT